MQLNAYIVNAADGYSLLKAQELPELAALAGTIAEISDAVRTAAAALTGREPEDFGVRVGY